MDLATEMVAIARLTPYVRNPRKNGKAIRQVADSLTPPGVTASAVRLVGMSESFAGGWVEVLSRVR